MDLGTRLLGLVTWVPFPVWDQTHGLCMLGRHSTTKPHSRFCWIHLWARLFLSFHFVSSFSFFTWSSGLKGDCEVSHSDSDTSNFSSSMKTLKCLHRTTITSQCRTSVCTWFCVCDLPELPLWFQQWLLRGQREEKIQSKGQGYLSLLPAPIPAATLWASSHYISLKHKALKSW